MDPPPRWNGTSIVDWRFVEVKSLGPVPRLTEAASGGSAAATYVDPRELLPPEQFALRGFMILKAVDVTDQEVLSSLSENLIDKESIVSHARFQGLQAKLRTLFRRPSLHLGLAAVEGDRVLVLNDAMSHERAASSRTRRTTRRPSSPARCTSGLPPEPPVIVDDLMAWPNPTDRRKTDRGPRGPHLRLRAATLPGQGDRYPRAHLAPAR